MRILFISDFRQKFAIAGILLYLISSSFIVYKVFGTIQKPVWNALYWIILVFSAISYTFLTFGTSFKLQKEFYHQLLSPLEVFFGKFLYNLLFIFLMGILLSLIFGLFANFPIEKMGLFIFTLLLGGIGISAGLSFLSALASSAELNSSMLSVLSLPLLLPIILLCLKLTAVALAIIVDTSYNMDIIYLLAIDCLIIGISILLFPYLWQS